MDINKYNVGDTFYDGEYGIPFHVINCPVCNHKTLDNYWICNECGWEFDNILLEDIYSPANDSNIKEYRENYLNRNSY